MMSIQNGMMSIQNGMMNISFKFTSKSRKFEESKGVNSPRLQTKFDYPHL